jgi:hypothetical protein
MTNRNGHDPSAPDHNPPATDPPAPRAAPLAGVPYPRAPEPDPVPDPVPEPGPAPEAAAPAGVPSPRAPEPDPVPEPGPASDAAAPAGVPEQGAPEAGAEPEPDGKTGTGGGQISNVHDKLFKQVMGVTENAASVLAAALPAEVIEWLDLANMTPAPTNYISEVLRERNSDVVYWVPVRGAENGEHALLHMLAEHQSTVDPIMPVRCFIYAGLMLAAYIRNHPKTKKVPAVLSVVYHQGLKGKWDKPVEFLNVIDLEKDAKEALARWLWKGEFFLKDLPVTSVDSLRAAHMTKVAFLMALMLRDLPRTADPVAFVLRYVEEFRAAESEDGGKDRVQPLHAYLAEEFDRRQYDDKQWRSVLEKIGPEAVKAGMSFLDTYKAEGKAEGRAEGRVEMLLEVLEGKFGTVPDELRQRVAAGTVSELQTWGTKFAKAKKIEDVFRQRRRTIFR